LTDVLEALAASNIALLIEAAGISETSVNFNPTAWSSMPHDVVLQISIKPATDYLHEKWCNQFNFLMCGLISSKKINVICKLI
jgi:hypothetical protein